MAKVIQLPVSNRPKTTSYRAFDETALEKMQKKYQKIAKELRKNSEGSNSSDIKALQELALMTWEIIPVAKATYEQYRSDRGIYAINGAVNQFREILADLRQLRTGDRQCKHIINKILLPNLSLLMQHYLNDCSELKKQLNKIPSRQRRVILTALNNAMTQQGNLFNEISQKIQQALAEYMVN